MTESRVTPFEQRIAERRGPVGSSTGWLVPALLALAALVSSCGLGGPVARVTASVDTVQLAFGNRLPLDLEWQMMRSIRTADATVIAHLVDSARNVVRTFDHPFPETWKRGGRVAYSFDLEQSAMAPALAPGSYELTIGLASSTGARFSLDAGSPEVASDEYVIARVIVPDRVESTPRFTFGTSWEPPQASDNQQVLATRWLGGRRSELSIWGVDTSGEVVLRFSTPALGDNGYQLEGPALDASDVVAVESDCGPVRGMIPTTGRGEIRVSITTPVPDQECAIRFEPNRWFVEPGSTRTLTTVLESLTWLPQEPEQIPDPAGQEVFTSASAEVVVSFDQARLVESFTLSNRGDATVVDPRLIVNDRKDWFDIYSIYEEVVDPTASDRDKAMAIWEFLVANRYHDIPSTTNAEMHDPVRLLNVYGYGFCDDAAHSFMMLSKISGLKARIWYLEGHVVAEAFYDDEWHMFDADGELFYLTDLGTVASVAQLSTDAELVRRYSSPNPLYFDTEHLVNLYTSRHDNGLDRGFHNAASRHAMSFELRPGESIMRSRKNWGLHVRSQQNAEPQVFGNGRFVFTPVFRDDLYRRGASKVVGVSGEGDPRQLVFTSTFGRDSAELAYPFFSPYPVLAGRAQLTAVLEGRGRLALEFSGDGNEWVPIWSWTDEGSIDTEISLDEILDRGTKRPFYRYFARLIVTAEAETVRLRLASLRFERDFQIAPHSLPEFHAGENLIAYFDAGEGQRDVELTYTSAQLP